MCEMDKRQRRAYRGQDPPRVRNKSAESLLREEEETKDLTSRSTPSSPTALQRAASLEKCFSDPEFFKRLNPSRKLRQDSGIVSSVSGKDDEPIAESCNPRNARSNEDFVRELTAKIDPSSCDVLAEVVFNVATNESDYNCSSVVTNGKDMAPVLGVPPPPPAPHMGPDGLILPRKPNHPYVGSNNHKDLHRELLFNQKVGKNVLNQKSELQRALEKQREAASRKEAERIREESFKDDPRTALQRAIEQRARHIRLAEQPQSTEPPNPLVTARAKLRTRTDSQ